MRNNLLSDKNMLLVSYNLAWLVISNSLQGVITHVDFFATRSTHNSAFTISISKNKYCIHNHGFWKFNSFLLSDQNYVRQTKNLTQTIHSSQNFIPNIQLKWDLLKREIQKFSINYSRKLAKERKENETLLENKLKKQQDNLNTEDNIQSYVIHKKELDSIYDYIVEGIRIWSKCDWYQHGGKLTKFFLNLEKTHDHQNQIRKLIFYDKEIDGDVEIFKNSKVSLMRFPKVSLSKMKVKLKNFYVLSLHHLLTTIKQILTKKTYLKLIYTMQWKTCKVINLLETMG